MREPGEYPDYCLSSTPGEAVCITGLMEVYENLEVHELVSGGTQAVSAQGSNPSSPT